MKILITTGLSVSDIGGPFQYAPRLKEEFERLGHSVEIAQYNSIERALLGILPKVLRVDSVIALDSFSVGIPSVMAARLFRKRVVVRVGGDFLWESYVQRT